MSVNTLGCTHLNIDLYRPMMTLFREQATSRSNLKIELCRKSIITMSENVVKNFILSLSIDFLAVCSLLCHSKVQDLLCLNTKE